MKVAAQIREKIKAIPSSYAFSYTDLNIPASEFLSTAKSLERMSKKGEIKKISKGIFYKPEESIFGLLPPNYETLMKKYLFENGERIGYFTGGQLYNQLSLTTQICFRTQIATNKGTRKKEFGWLRINCIKSLVPVTNENYELLGILDAMKDINLISDAPVNRTVKMLMSRIKTMKKKEIDLLIQCALKYPPRTRAMVGAILQCLFINDFDLKSLKESLNPGTKYRLGVKLNTLSTVANWNIK